MAYRHQRWAAAQQVKRSEKSVLCALASHADKDGRCYPGAEGIGQWAGCSERTVRRALEKLEEKGLIEVERRVGQTSVYHLTMDDDATPDMVTPRTSRPGTPDMVTGDPGHGDTPDMVTPRTSRPGTPDMVTGDPGHGDRRTATEQPQNSHLQSGTRASETDAVRACLDAYRHFFPIVMVPNEQLMAIRTAVREHGAEFTLWALAELWNEGKVRPPGQFIIDRARGRKVGGPRPVGRKASGRKQSQHQKNFEVWEQREAEARAAGVTPPSEGFYTADELETMRRLREGKEAAHG